MKLVSRFKVAFIGAALLLALVPQHSKAVLPASQATKTSWGKFVDGAFEVGKVSWPYLATAVAASLLTLGIEHGIKLIKESKEKKS